MLVTALTEWIFEARSLYNRFLYVHISLLVRALLHDLNKIYDFDCDYHLTLQAESQTRQKQSSELRLTFFVDLYKSGLHQLSGNLDSNQRGAIKG